MRILFVSNLFPDRAEAYRGLDNATVLHHLAAGAEIRVLSPRATLPWRRPNWEPRPEDGVFSPQYVPARYLPKIGSRVNHRLFANALRPAILSLRKEFPFDVVLCAWAYPDTCAVALLSPAPLVAVTQGTDVHTYLSHPVRRRLIVGALNQASSVIARSGDLGRRLREAGVTKERIHTIYNGVDQTIFKPSDSAAARAELGLPLNADIVLFVGNMVLVKDPHLTLATHQLFSSARSDRRRLLVMVGGGPMEPDIRARAETLKLDVCFAGRQKAVEVARYMQAADCLLLTSHNEGMPNVILEAISCGLPIVTSNVGGISEIVSVGRGICVNDRSPALLARAVEEVLGRRRGDPPPSFAWSATARAYRSLLEIAVETQGIGTWRDEGF